MKMPCGDLPTGMLPTIFREGMSTTATDLPQRCVTHSVLPSAERPCR